MWPRGVMPSGTVTFLFTDVEGSTPAWERYEREMGAAHARHDEILQEVLSDHGGYVFSTGGDGVGAAFSTASAALRSAVAIQRALGVERWPAPITLRVRMGLHTGVAVEREGDYFGASVVRAARLMALTDGGCVVLSAATAALATGLPAGVEVVALGTARLKGLAAPEQVFALRGDGIGEPHALVDARDPRAGRVPRVSGALVGRGEELAELVRLVGEDRVVVVTGAGGVGKTALAAATAKACADKFDEVWWVDLTTIARDEDLAGAVADTVGAPATPGEEAVRAVGRLVGSRRVLVVLDNCEHLGGGVREVADRLGDACSGLVILATSRERLGVVGERSVRVTPLPCASPDSASVALLVSRLGADLVLDDVESMNALAEIAARVDGLPLALELAAARCRQLGPVEVAERLGHEFGLLADDSRTVQRQHTLDDTLRWSVDLLAPIERLVLAGLSVFAGPFSLSAAEAVTAGGKAAGAWRVDAVIGSLVDKSLVERSGRRFRLLQTTQAFARSLLEQTDDNEPAHARLAAYVLDRLGVITDGLAGSAEAEWVVALDEEWANVRQVFHDAVTHDDAETAAGVVISLAYEAFLRRPEVFGWAEIAAARFGAQHGAHRHELLAVAGLAVWMQGDVARGLALCEQALACDPDPGHARFALPEAAAVGALIFSGQAPRAVELCERTIEAIVARGDQWLEAHMRGNLVFALANAGLPDEARRQARRAVEVAKLTGNPTVGAYTRVAFVMAGTGAGRDLDAAILDESRLLALSVSNTWAINLLASAEVQLANLGSAEEGLSRALNAAQTLHDAGWVTNAWTMLWSVCTLLFTLGRDDDGYVLLGGCRASGVGLQPFQTEPAPMEAGQLRHLRPHQQTLTDTGTRATSCRARGPRPIDGYLAGRGAGHHDDEADGAAARSSPDSPVWLP